MADFDALMQPISADNPSGDDLRLDASDSTFAQLEEMRKEVDPAFDPGGEARSADWRGVISLCEEVLTTRTKDLEIAAFYTQGLIATEGLGGLLTGLRLLSGLTAEFWETVFPGQDEGEIIEPIRARPLSWIGSSKEFLATVKTIPVAAPIGEEMRTWFDYEQSQRVDEAARQADQSAYQELISTGLITGDAWRNALGGTPPERLETLIAGLKDCTAALADLNKVCEDKFQDDAPFMLDLSNLLDDIQSFLEQFQSSGGGVASTSDTDSPRQAAAMPATPPDVGMAPPTGAGAPAGAGPAGPVNSRDEAYRRLRDVAAFLRRTEPHSPVPALIDRAVRWGNMSFEKLFEDFVKNRDVRTQTRDLLGLEDETAVKPPAEAPKAAPAAPAPGGGSDGPKRFGS